MEHDHHGRPPTRRRVLGDASLRANENTHTQHRPGKHDHGHDPSLPPKQRIRPQPIVWDATPAEQHLTPQNKRISAVVSHEPRPHNSKRDSAVSNASTNASNTTRRRKTHIGPWQLGRTIGRGGCSRVRLVRHSGTGQFGAAKIISKATAEKVRALSLANLIKSAENDPTLHPGGKVIPFGLEREICIMKLLDHPNIVRLYDIWENRDELYLIMEFIEGGELFTYIHEQQGGLIEIHVVHIFRQIIAALIYCHRISIHHRDLKPENILLDRDTMTVKLVDFGMAALQPAGKKLTTPCGSPHYAAPEVIKTTAYDGSKADVWSCGVILYVLLTGTPPFNYSGEDRDLKYLFRAIEKGDYVMPDNISHEAQDLIKKILIPDPLRRIGLDEIWRHPFMRKYSKELGFVGEYTSRDHWAGPLPAIASWETLERTTVNREILRYLRTLWHSENEEVIVQRLISQEANQEKYFYSALKKYHDDQLENYQPSAHHPVTYSNSDHHHNARHPPTNDDIEKLPPSKHKRSQSGYSILNNEHMFSKHSFYDSAVSEASYDPFRASKQPIVPGTPGLQNAAFDRGSGHGSRRPRPTTALDHSAGASLRKQALHSVVSRGSSKRSTPSQRSGFGRSGSRSTLGSSHWASSPPVVARTGGIGRRGVSFSHLRERRSSAATTSTVDYSTRVNSPVQSTSGDGRRGSVGSYRSSVRSVKNQPSAAHRIKSRLPGTSAIPRLRLRGPDSPTKYIQTEARKVSTELGRVMEEAFNRSSMSSSICTTGMETFHEASMSQYDTPPTSISNRDSGGSTIAFPNTQTMLAARPLPPLPTETPNTFLHRKLAETRADIARRLTEDDGNTEHFSQVLEHLDRLLLSPSNTKRVVSAPARPAEHAAILQVIPEEVKADVGDGFEKYKTSTRAVTDPIRSQTHRAATAQGTIRVVEPSPNHVAPLNIRKRSGASLYSKALEDGASATCSELGANGSIRSYRDVQNDLFAARTNNNAPPQENNNNTIKKKKSSWFRRNMEEKNHSAEPPEAQIRKKKSIVPLQIPEAWQSLDDRMKSPNQISGVEFTKHVAKQSMCSVASEFPMRNTETATAKNDGASRKGFFGLFGRKKETKARGSMELALNFSSSSILSENNNLATRNGPPEVQMNWLSRFLHIKPVSKILCFQVGRGKVRQDLVRLLRDWQRFGVHDVSFDRSTNVINARVDKSNHLKIKPVHFAIELFVVLEHGRRANLCLARFTQTRGAASSFRKVVDIVEDVCRARCILVEDTDKQATMLEVLD